VYLEERRRLKDQEATIEDQRLRLLQLQKAKEAEQYFNGKKVWL
jgi:hypothetical protein